MKKLSQNYSELFKENDTIIKIIKNHDCLLLAGVLKEIGGSYTWTDNNMKPVVCGYFGDDPADLTISKAWVDKYNDVWLEASNGYCSDEVALINIADGHIKYIFDNMILSDTDNMMDKDLYSIELDPVTNEKQVHILANLWESDTCHKMTEYTFLIIPLKEFISMHPEDIMNRIMEVKQYEKDFADIGELIGTFCGYFNGEEAEKRLDYADLTMDTPCGNYYSAQI